MFTSTVCKVNFVDRESAVYFPGELFKCSVRLINTEPQTLQEIGILVAGRTKVQWSKGLGKYIIKYKSKVTHLASKLILHKDPKADTFELSAGSHSYDFETKLPKELPSSYLGQFGENHYAVIITLSRAWICNTVFIHPFTIISRIDLNQSIQFKNPTNKIGEETSYVNCMKYIQLKVKIPHSGYTPGQFIPISLEVSKSSRLSCSRVIVKLHRHVKFEASLPRADTKYTKTGISQNELPGITRSTNNKISTMLLVPSTPPSTPPSSPKICDIIRIWYTISFEAVTGLFHRNLKMSVPITIGTVPLVESMNNVVKPPLKCKNNVQK